MHLPVQKLFRGPLLRHVGQPGSNRFSIELSLIYQGPGHIPQQLLIGGQHRTGVVFSIVETLPDAFTLSCCQSGRIWRPKPSVAVDAKAKLIVHCQTELRGLSQIGGCASASSG